MFIVGGVPSLPVTTAVAVTRRGILLRGGGGASDGDGGSGDQGDPVDDRFPPFLTFVLVVLLLAIGVFVADALFSRRIVETHIVTVTRITDYYRNNKGREHYFFHGRTDAGRVLWDIELYSRQPIRFRIGDRARVILSTRRSGIFGSVTVYARCDQLLPPTRSAR